MSLAFLLTVCLVPASNEQPYCSLSAKAEVETTASLVDCSTMAQGVADSVLAGQLESQQVMRSLALGRCMSQQRLPDVIAGARDYLTRQGYRVEVIYY